MKKKVVFFGSIGIARRILEEVVLTQDVELLGVCCEKLENTWREEQGVYDFCLREGVPIINMDSLLLLSPDLGISVRYNQIIKKEIIDRFRMGIVNTHGGILPEYRGSYCNINAILNGESEFGATLHYIDEGVDTGDIVDIKKVQIQKEQTGFDLYKISEELCYDLIADNIDAILTGTNDRTSQAEYILNGHSSKEYKAKQTLTKKEIALESLDSENTCRAIRAFDSDSHEPAYTKINGQKIYLRVRH